MKYVCIEIIGILKVKLADHTFFIVLSVIQRSNVVLIIFENPATPRTKYQLL